MHQIEVSEQAPKWDIGRRQKSGSGTRVTYWVNIFAVKRIGTFSFVFEDEENIEFKEQRCPKAKAFALTGIRIVGAHIILRPSANNVNTWKRLPSRSTMVK